MHGARHLYEVGHGRARFLGKKFFAPRIGKMNPKWAKNRVYLSLLENLVNLLLNFIYKETLYYFLCSCTNPIFWVNFCSWDMAENVLRIMGGCGQKWVWLIRSQVSKIDCISRMHRWSNFIYNETLYYFLCSCTNPIFWVNFCS